jgi:hypothetical protein
MVVVGAGTERIVGEGSDGVSHVDVVRVSSEDKGDREWRALGEV